MTQRKAPAKQDSPDFTSGSVRTMVREAKALLIDNDETLDAEIASLADEADLVESERQQLAEISRLLGNCGDQDSVLETLRRDGEFVIIPNDDRMMLTMTVHPPMAGGRAVEVEHILTWLRDRDIQHGVDLHAIRQSLQQAQEKTVEDVVIVRGKLPKSGRDGYVEIHARRANEEPLERVWSSDGKTKAAGMWLCAEGDQVLLIVSPNEGVPGHNALGETIAPPPVNEGQIDVGPNIALDGSVGVAQVNGVIILTNDRVEIRKVLVITQPVTRSDKPIDFDGEVHLRAGVGTGAVVKATGNIMIDGVVEAATIESRRGSVKLRHGVAGQHRAAIRAEEDVVARFVENAFILAGRDVIVETGSLHSRLVAGRAIHCNRGRGQLIGGSAMAGTLIEVKQLGAKSNVTTDIIVGICKQTLEQMGEIDHKITQFQEREKACADVADRMQRAVGDPAKLKGQELQMYAHLRKNQLVCQHRIRLLRTEREQILAEAAKSSQGRIDVHEEMYPGTQIRIGDATMNVTKPQPRCRITYDKNQRKLTTGRVH